MIHINHLGVSCSLAPGHSRARLAICQVAARPSSVTLCCSGIYSNPDVTNQYDSNPRLIDINWSTFDATFQKYREDIPDGPKTAHFNHEDATQVGGCCSIGQPDGRDNRDGRALWRRDIVAGSSGVAIPERAGVRDPGPAGSPLTYIDHPTYGILPSSNRYLALLAGRVAP